MNSLHRLTVLSTAFAAFGAAFALAAPAPTVASPTMRDAFSSLYARSPFAPRAESAEFREIRMGMSPAQRGRVTVAHAPNVRDFGRIHANAPVEIGLIMRFRHEAELTALTFAQGQRRSPYFHRYLTSAQFNTYFAADTGTYAKTLATLQRRGFRIEQTFPNRSAIRAIAPAATVEKYFSTELHQVYQQGHGMRHMNVTPGIIPDELRGSIVSVAGLHSAVSMRFPIKFGHRQPNRNTFDRVKRARLARAGAAAQPVSVANAFANRFAKIRSAAATPAPITTSTPSVGPGPDPTEVPNDITTEGAIGGGYDPTVFAASYDYPVDHGYGGRNHATGSVIDSDYLDSDEADELQEFGIKRTGGLGTRVCTNPLATAGCDGVIGAGDPEGESTLDAETILSLAPAAAFYEYLTPDNSGGLNDIGLEFAYERVVSDNLVDSVNSSFGGCETDDPDGNYAYNYIATEGAALGITFNASTGDTGSGNCGTYITNGAPQTLTNASSPSSDYYFTAVGGTDFFQLTSCTAAGVANCYTHEDVWTFGGGGSSVYEQMPSWQAQVVAAQTVAVDTTTTGRNTPDLVLTADPEPPGNAMMLYYNGSATAIGGTSLSSPMWTAMQAEINQVQNSRNGWVLPSLYATYYAQNCGGSATGCTGTASFAFNNVIGGSNGAYQSVPGYNDANGLGSPEGWELAGSEYGSPGSTPLPIVTPSPTPVPSPTSSGMMVAPTATPTASATPYNGSTPNAVGTGYTTTTIAGNANTTTCAKASTDGTGRAACFYAPAGIAYDPASQTSLNTQSTTDNFLFVGDYGTGAIRTIDLTTTGFPVTTVLKNTYKPSDQIIGLGYFPDGNAANQSAFGGLYILAAGDPPGAGGATQTGGNVFNVTLPAPAATTSPPAAAVNGVAVPAAIAFNGTLGTEAGITSETNGDFYDVSFAGAVNENATIATTLGTKGNYGIANFPAGANNVGMALWYVTDAGLNSVSTVTDVPDAAAATVAAVTSGAPLSSPRGIVYVSSTNAFYIANCGGNNILRLAPGATKATIVAGYGAPTELDGYNTAAGFDCPFGITTDGATTPSLYVTDFGGNVVRKITNLN